MIAPMTVPIGRITTVAKPSQQARLQQLQICHDGMALNALGRESRPPQPLDPVYEPRTVAACIGLHGSLLPQLPEPTRETLVAPTGI